MAVTFTVEGASVIGSQRQIWGTVAVTSTGGAFTTGLGYVNSCNISYSDDTEGAGAQIQRNTATNGSVTLTVASGDFTNANFSATGYGGG